MRRRFFRRRFAGRKRATKWISGVSTFDLVAPASSIGLTFVALPNVTNGRVVQVALTQDSDFQYVGGEPMVLQRVVYELAFYAGRIQTDTANRFHMRMAFAVAQVLIGSGGGTTSIQDHVTSTGLGAEDILHTRDVVVHEATGFQAVGADFTDRSRWLTGDFKVKRRLERDRHLRLDFQTSLDGASTPQDFRVIGFIRMLVTGPRR